MPFRKQGICYHLALCMCFLAVLCCAFVYPAREAMAVGEVADVPKTMIAGILTAMGIVWVDQQIMQEKVKEVYQDLSQRTKDWLNSVDWQSFEDLGAAALTAIRHDVLSDVADTWDDLFGYEVAETVDLTTQFMTVTSVSALEAACAASSPVFTGYAYSGDYAALVRYMTGNQAIGGLAAGLNLSDTTKFRFVGSFSFSQFDYAVYAARSTGYNVLLLSSNISDKVACVARSSEGYPIASFCTPIIYRLSSASTQICVPLRSSGGSDISSADFMYTGDLSYSAYAFSDTVYTGSISTDFPVWDSSAVEYEDDVYMPVVIPNSIDDITSSTYTQSVAQGSDVISDLCLVGKCFGDSELLICF